MDKTNTCQLFDVGTYFCEVCLHVIFVFLVDDVDEFRQLYGMTPTDFRVRAIAGNPIEETDEIAD